MKGYVRFRILAERVRRGDTTGFDSPSFEIGAEASKYQVINIRCPPNSPVEDQFESLLSLEMLDFEYWITELWHDFLIEPTPYLVASAITYLGFTLLFVQYYTVMWRFFCFCVQFVPWDDSVGFG